MNYNHIIIAIFSYQNLFNMNLFIYILLGLSLITSCSKVANTPPPFTAGAEVNTNSANSILCKSASFSGIIKDSVSFIEKGIVYAITTNPSITNNKILDPNSGITISAKSNTLLENTKYFYRAYIIKAGNNIVYGGEGNFTTPKCSGGGGGGGIDSKQFISTRS